jgi:Lrp/AsnC family transcriptional regulator, leucine-responsive regulatory protein
MEIDSVDKKIIELLQKDATLTSNEIAKEVTLSSSAVHERIRKLHAHNIIKKIAAFVQAKALGKSLCAFIYVLIDTPLHSKHFLKEIAKQENIMECHHITGEYSYLIKVRVKDTHELEQFITEFLKSQPGVTRTLTQVVLSSPKDGDTIIE